MEKIHQFVDMVGNDKYLLRYSISAKTRNKNSKHVTPDIFMEMKDDFLMFMCDLKNMYSNMRFRSERPFFKCTFSPSELNGIVKELGITFFCAMEFTVAPSGVCGLCPPITLLANPYEARPVDEHEFMHAIDIMRNLTKELQYKPSFERCHDCKDRCQGGCLSYKF